MELLLTGDECSLEDGFLLVVPLRNLWRGLYCPVSSAFDAGHEEGTKGTNGCQYYAEFCRQYEPVCLPC